MRSSTSIKYIFNSFLLSERLLNKKLLNIYLIIVHERDNSKFLKKMSENGKIAVFEGKRGRFRNLTKV